ncbi:MAG: lipase family protein [Oligoflexia bacterium]|nr:lipase family protein [Oligoflexia bacterium]
MLLLLIAEFLSGQVNSGFWNAFSLVKDSIKESLKQIEGYQLFFTGHSLGGALATIAVRYFSNDSSGACYTFGAPPIGTKKVEEKLKTPLYRIVNDLDIVPHMPNPIISYISKIIYKLIKWVVTILKLEVWFPKNIDNSIKTIIKDSLMYRHIGYGSFLVGTEKNPVLRYQLDFWTKIYRYRSVFNPYRFFDKSKRLITDHSIDTYSKKLGKWALKRQS